jgi:hypothetical protein
MGITDDRWTCPRCNKTFVFDGSGRDYTRVVVTLQQRHAEEHAAGWPAVDRKDPRTWMSARKHGVPAATWLDLSTRVRGPRQSTNPVQLRERLVKRQGGSE